MRTIEEIKAELNDLHHSPVSYIPRAMEEDICLQRELIEALEAENQRLREALEVIHDAAWTCEQDELDMWYTLEGIGNACKQVLKTKANVQEESHEDR